MEFFYLLFGGVFIALFILIFAVLAGKSTAVAGVKIIAALIGLVGVCLLAYTYLHDVDFWLTVLAISILIGCCFLLIFPKDIKVPTLAMICAIFLRIIALPFGEYFNYDSDFSFADSSSYDDPEKWKTIDGVEQNIDGTTWQYILPLDSGQKHWYKLEFKNNRVYAYSARPSDGTWGEPYVYDYTVKEDRYADTGEKFVYVEWRHDYNVGYNFHYMIYQFVPSVGLYSLLTDTGRSLPTIMEQTDEDAW